MQRVSPNFWSRVPGYDSDNEEEDGQKEVRAGDSSRRRRRRHVRGSDSTDEESGEDPDESVHESDDEASAPLSPQERLAEVLRVLGNRWCGAPCVDFQPARTDGKTYVPKMSAAAMAGYGPKPPAFRIDRIHAPLVRDTFLANGFRPTTQEDWLMNWSGPRMRENIYKMMHEFQRVNHFPGSTELTRKDRLWENFSRTATAIGEDTYDFVPDTFVLPAEAKAFKKRFMKTKGEHLWIVKPAASSQGKGIFILRKLGELPLKEAAVVSRYIENPLLIQGLKFDLRIYVLVTSFDPLRAFVYREGLTRFASKPYSTEEEHLDDVYRHLTNYSINKSADNFLENQRVQADNYGHKWSLSALNRHLQCVGVDVDLMWSGIMDLIVKTLLAVEPTISAATRENCTHEQSCFELYGFDVLVDEDLKPWLLEVNLSPSMQADSPLDKQIKSSLVSDAFNLVGVRHVDQQTVTNARMHSRMLYLEKLKLGMPSFRRRTTTLSSGATRDPMKRSQEHTLPAGDGETGEDGGEGAVESEPLAPTGSRGSTRSQPEPSREDKEAAEKAAEIRRRGGVDLASLTEGQMKIVASALEEFGRCDNFIRLYPTPEAIKRYEPITRRRGAKEDLQAQVLAAALFGNLRVPPPPEPRRQTPPAEEPVSPTPSMESVRRGAWSEAAEEEKAADETAADEKLAHQQAEDKTAEKLRVKPEKVDSRRSSKVAVVEQKSEEPPEITLVRPGKVAASRPGHASHSQELATSALSTLKVLGSKMGSQLVVMEYLVRLVSASSRMDQNVRSRLQNDEHPAALNVMSCFQQELGFWLKSIGSKQGSDTAVAAAFPLTGNLLGDLLAVARQALVQLLAEVWGSQTQVGEIWAQADRVRSAAAAGADVSTTVPLRLSTCAPAAFAQSATGCRALAAIAGLCTADLEFIIRGPFCPMEVRALFSVPELGSPPRNPRQRLPAPALGPGGPLGELECILKVHAPKPAGKVISPPVQMEELPTVASRLVRQGLSFSAPQLLGTGQLGGGSRLGKPALRPLSPTSQMRVKLQLFGPGGPMSQKFKFAQGRFEAPNCFNSDIEL